MKPLQYLKAHLNVIVPVILFMTILLKGGIGMIQINKMADLFSGMFHENLLPLDQARKLEIDFKDLRLKTFKYLGTTNPEEMDTLKAAIQDSMEGIRQQIKSQSLTSLEEIFEPGADLYRQIVALHYDFNTKKAYQMIAADSQQNYEQTVSLLTEIIEKKKKTSEENLEQGITIRRNVLAQITVETLLLAMIIAFAIRYLLKKGEEQKRELEQKVQERTVELRRKTNDIQSMLHNLHQGIFMITAEGKIHPEYSTYLENILETKELAQQPVMSLLFSHTNLGADTLNEVETTIISLLGEEAIMFEFNHHLLISELERTPPNGHKKFLELGWDPILNDQRTIDKILVTVRDVTELKRLQKESAEQKRELEIIGQILSVSQEQFNEFVNTAEEFIHDNEHLIQQTVYKDSEVIATLFRNIHTVKGNARTYGFLHLTHTVHETEHEYDQLRKDPQYPWEPPHLLERLHQTEDLLKQYTQINSHKLGRKGAGRRGSVDKYYMVDKEQVLSLIELLESANPGDINALKQVNQKARGALRTIGTEKLTSLLSPIVESLPSLAEELEKGVPKVSITDHNILIKNQANGLLKNIFMHLFRNSMDHGIESHQVRRAEGKPESGHIEVELRFSEDQLQFLFKDDGQGLNLSRIRKKAIESKLIQETDHPAPQELAQLIFSSGFSTADKVTEVSGRGVGMDTVKKFVEREKGQVFLRLVDRPTQSGFQPFEVVITFPQGFGVQSEAS